MFDRVDNFLVKTDRICDYVPVVSTISNLTALFQKYFVFNVFSEDEIQANRYYAHLSQKSTSRCIVLLIPLIGNIIVAIRDNFLKREPFAAVRQNGLALQYVSEELRDDRNLILAAVQQNGLALQFASERLRRDEGVVLAAVKQNSMSVQFSGEFDFTAALEITRVAVTQDHKAKDYKASEHVQTLCPSRAEDLCRYYNNMLQRLTLKEKESEAKTL